MRDARASLLFSTARVPNNDLLLAVLIGREEKVEWCEANQIFLFYYLLFLLFFFPFFYFCSPVMISQRVTTTYVAVCLSG